MQHNLAFNHPFPLAIDRAEGAHLTDRDGNVYIDFLQAGGPTLLGSNYGPVNEQVAEVVRESGPVTGLFHEYELKLADSIEFVRAVRPRRAYALHDALLNDNGARVYDGNMAKLSGCDYGHLTPGTAAD